MYPVDSRRTARARGEPQRLAGDLEGAVPRTRASVGAVNRARTAITIVCAAAWAAGTGLVRADEPPSPPANPATGGAPTAGEAPVSGFRFATDRRVRHEIDLSRMRNGGDRPDPRDFIPAIRRPASVPRGEAVHVEDDDAVVGVELDGEARAYPLLMLEMHEIVDDVLAGTEIAVTYCPLCDAAVAYRRRLPAAKGAPEEPLVFGCSGYLYDSDVLIYDAQTETFWQQLTGRGVVGPLTGSVLSQVPVRRTTMRAWETEHPRTTVLSWRTEHAYPMSTYRRSNYAGYRASKQLQFPVGARDPRLPLKATVFGLRVGDADVAVPEAALVGRAEPLAFSVGASEVRVTAGEGAREPRAEARAAGDAAGTWRPLEGLRCYWFAWFAFHPATRVVDADGSVGPAATDPGGGK